MLKILCGWRFKFSGMWCRIVGWVVLSFSMDCDAYIFKGPAVQVFDLWRWRHCDSLQLRKPFNHRQKFTFQNHRILNHTVLKTSSCLNVYFVVVTKLIIQCNSTISYKNWTTVLLACDNNSLLNWFFYPQSTATFRHCGFKPLCSSFDRSGQWRILPSEPEM